MKTFRKMLSVLVLAALLMTAATHLLHAAKTGPGGQSMGDVNFDGNIDIDDILLLRDAIFGIEELTGNGFTAADLNFDGEINIEDILLLRDIIFGEEPPSWPDPTSIFDETLAAQKHLAGEVFTREFAIGQADGTNEKYLSHAPANVPEGYINRFIHYKGEEAEMLLIRLVPKNNCHEIIADAYIVEGGEAALSDSCKLGQLNWWDYADADVFAKYNDDIDAWIVYCETVETSSSFNDGTSWGFTAFAYQDGTFDEIIKGDWSGSTWEEEDHTTNLTTVQNSGLEAKTLAYQYAYGKGWRLIHQNEDIVFLASINLYSPYHFNSDRHDEILAYLSGGKALDPMLITISDSLLPAFAFEKYLATQNNLTGETFARDFAIGQADGTNEKYLSHALANVPEGYINHFIHFKGEEAEMLLIRLVPKKNYREIIAEAYIIKDGEAALSDSCKLGQLDWWDYADADVFLQYNDDVDAWIIYCETVETSSAFNDGTSWGFTAFEYQDGKFDEIIKKDWSGSDWEEEDHTTNLTAVQNSGLEAKTLAYQYAYGKGMRLFQQNEDIVFLANINLYSPYHFNSDRYDEVETFLAGGKALEPMTITISDIQK